MQKAESLSSLSSLSAAQLDDVAEPSSPQCEDGGLPFSRAASAAAVVVSEAAGNHEGPSSTSGGLLSAQLPPSAAGTSPPASAAPSAVLQHQPSAQSPSLDPSPFNIPMTGAGSPSDAADAAWHPKQSSSAAAEVQLPRLSVAAASPASPRGSPAGATAPEPASVDKKASQRPPELPARQAHMVALAEAEELERGLLTGRSFSRAPRCSGQPALHMFPGRRRYGAGLTCPGHGAYIYIYMIAKCSRDAHCRTAAASSGRRCQ